MGLLEPLEDGMMKRVRGTLFLLLGRKLSNFFQTSKTEKFR